MNRRTLLTSALCALGASQLPLPASIAPAWAEEKRWRHGLSLFGEPKYPPGFAHFDYVNAAAPKGGSVREIALGKNPARISAERTREASEAAVRKTYGAFLPGVNLSGSWSRTSTEVSVLETVRRNRQYSVGASWNLFNGFSSVGNLQVAKAARGEAEALADAA